MGVMGINPKYDFFKFNMGISTSWLFKKTARNILMKISRIGPLTALNKMA
jgi:hypothetical protein